MSYVEEITEPLISILTNSGGLPVQRLAGPAVNVEFWVSEVIHVFGVIDGYGERFEKLKVSEKTSADRLRPQFHPFRPEKPLRPGISDHELKELRRRLCESISQVLRRCYKEGFVSEKELDEYAERLDLDIGELKRKKGR